MPQSVYSLVQFFAVFRPFLRKNEKNNRATLIRVNLISVALVEVEYVGSREKAPY